MIGQQLAELVAGAIVFGSGTLFGVVMRSVLPRRHRVAPQPALVCSCRDGYGTHDEQTGRCNGQIKRAAKWGKDNWGDVKTTGWEYAPCPCLRYDGPLPIETYVSRGLTLPPAEGGR